MKSKWINVEHYHPCMSHEPPVTERNSWNMDMIRQELCFFTNKLLYSSPLECQRNSQKGSTAVHPTSGHTGSTAVCTSQTTAICAQWTYCMGKYLNRQLCVKRMSFILIFLCRPWAIISGKPWRSPSLRIVPHFWRTVRPSLADTRSFLSKLYKNDIGSQRYGNKSKYTVSILQSPLP